jgi:hypothetical protein
MHWKAVLRLGVGIVPDRSPKFVAPAPWPDPLGADGWAFWGQLRRCTGSVNRLERGVTPVYLRSQRLPRAVLWPTVSN